MSKDNKIPAWLMCTPLDDYEFDLIQLRIRDNHHYRGFDGVTFYEYVFMMYRLNRLSKDWWVFKDILTDPCWNWHLSEWESIEQWVAENIPTMTQESLGRIHKVWLEYDAADTFTKPYTPTP